MAANIESQNITEDIDQKKSIFTNNLKAELGKKILKISQYSKCKCTDCNCSCWVANNETVLQNLLTIFEFDLSSLDLMCKCGHALSDHMLQFEGSSQNHIDIAFLMALDCDNVKEALHSTASLSKINFYQNLLKKLIFCIEKKKNILNCTQDFGKYFSTGKSVREILINYYVLKYCQLPKSKVELGYELTRTILNFMNSVDLENYLDNTNEKELYIFNRWMAYCSVPIFLQSFKCYLLIDVFGKDLISLMIKKLKEILLFKSDLFISENYKNDDLQNLKNELPFYLENLENTINSATSSITDIDATDSFAPHMYPLVTGLYAVGKRKSLSFTEALKSSNNVIKELKLFEQKKAIKRSFALINEDNCFETHSCKLKRMMNGLDKFSNCNSVNFSPMFTIISYCKGLPIEESEKLLKFRNIVYLQLPKMPEEYITKNVFDSNHKNLLLVVNKEVVGGICFRMFPTQGFTEIVFLVVLTENQVQGYGSALMNKLKDYHLSKGIYHLLTCADSNATGFFKKQQFTNIKLCQGAYKEYLKDYHASSQVGCSLNPQIPYSELMVLREKNKRIVESLIKKKQEVYSEKVFPGLKFENDHVPLDKIPGFTDKMIKAIKMKSCASSADNKNSLKEDLESILSELYNHNKSHHIKRLASPLDNSDKGQNVNEPMDLLRIKTKLKEGKYYEQKEFVKDIRNVFCNARIAIQNDCSIEKEVDLLEIFFNNILKQYK